MCLAPVLHIFLAMELMVNLFLCSLEVFSGLRIMLTSYLYYHHIVSKKTISYFYNIVTFVTMNRFSNITQTFLTKVITPP